VVESNFILAELSIQARHEMDWWAGAHHALPVPRRRPARMGRKKVV
jgi:hypothetical protein